MKQYFCYLVVEIWVVNYNEDSISKKSKKKSVTNRQKLLQNVVLGITGHRKIT